jgi:hypothetical protein
MQSLQHELKKDYEIRLYQSGDEKQIIPLLESVFGRWPGLANGCNPPEHWRWKYQENPFKRLDQIAVGVSKNLIVGCRHSFPLRIKIGNGVFWGVHIGDTVVSPSFRRMGIWTKMNELNEQKMRESGLSLCYCVTNNPILVKSLTKRYRKFPHIVMNLSRINDVDLHLKKRSVKYAFMKKNGFRLLELINRFRNTLRPSTSSYYDFYIQEVNIFDDRINVFWEEIKDQYSFIIERSPDYLNWRYCDPRAGNYLIKIAHGDGKILGYIVLTINKHQKDYPLGNIVDLLALPNRPNVADALIVDAVNHFTRNNINFISCLAIKNHPYSAIFKRNGFIIRGEKIHLFYKEGVKVEELRKFEIDAPSRIHFAYGDFDAI